MQDFSLTFISTRLCVFFIIYKVLNFYSVTIRICSRVRSTKRTFILPSISTWFPSPYPPKPSTQAKISNIKNGLLCSLLHGDTPYLTQVYCTESCCFIWARLYEAWMTFIQRINTYIINLYTIFLQPCISLFLGTRAQSKRNRKGNNSVGKD